MDPQEIRKGMKVIVKKGLQRTHSLWTTDEHMHKMARSGSAFVVKDIREVLPNYGINTEWCIEVDGYYFSPEDLELYEPEGPSEVLMENIKKTVFDPKSL